MSEVKSDKLSPRTDSGTTTLGDSGDTFLVNTGAKLDINGTELILDADADTSITADTDDQIDIRIAGADDFQFTANKFLVQTGSTIDMNGTELILDADADTSITADTDDQIDIRISGADDFQFTANTFNVLSGSTLAVNSGATIANSGTATGFPVSAKNLVFNGSMQIAQRDRSWSAGPNGSNAGDTTSQEGLACDMWSTKHHAGTEESRFLTYQTGNVLRGWSSDAPAGFNNALKVDCTVAESAVGAAEAQWIFTKIEGQNLQHLKWGASGALDVTVSFWFKSPKTGTHVVTLFQPDADRAYPATFTIASADTWENFSITYSGDTSGSGIVDDDTSGLDIIFPLIAGSDRFKTAGQWQAAATAGYACTGQQNLLDNASNNILIAGVQLEVGASASDFEHIGYGEELIRCQRYFQVFSRPWYASGLATSTTNVLMNFPLGHTPMRKALPSTIFTADTGFMYFADGSTRTLTGAAVNYHGTNPGQAWTIACTTSGMTANTVGFFAHSGGTWTFIALDADM